MLEIEKIFTKDRADFSLFSALFFGNRGVGKRTAVIKIIKKCSPSNMWEKISNNKTCDIVEFVGNEGIAECKEKLKDFDTLPKELPHKWLIFNNIEYASQEVNNFLLKLIEERKNFHVFITTTDKSSVSPALLSRLHLYKFTSLTQEQIYSIINNNKALGYLLPYVNKFPFRSIFEIKTYFSLSFEEVFQSLFLEKTDSFEFIKQIDSFLIKLKEVQKIEQDSTILFFLEFILLRMAQSPDYSGIYYQFLLRKTKEKFAKGLFVPGIGYEVNKENQLKSFLLSLFYLKKLGA